MSSRVMIIKNCEECPRSGLGFLKPRRVCLEMFRDDGSECECPEEGTPDWCPLPTVPAKREVHEDYNTGMLLTGQDFVNVGWNQCIDAITREEER